MSESKKHHYISAFILRNFSSESSGQLQVHRLAEQRSYLANPLDVGARNNAHTVSSRMDRNPRFFEDRMADFESEAALTVRELIAGRGAEVSDRHRQTLKLLIVLHVFRHPEHHARIAREIRAEEEDKLRQLGTDIDSIVQDLLVGAMSYAAVPGDPRAGAHDPARWALYSTYMDRFTWSIVRYETDSLVTGDRLVCSSGSVDPGPNAVPPRASLYGFHGIAWCRRMTLALSPRTGLMLNLRPDAPPLSAELFNRTTVRNSRYFVANNPSWPTVSPGLHEAALEHIHQQREHAARQFRDLFGDRPDLWSQSTAPEASG